MKIARYGGLVGLALATTPVAADAYTVTVNKTGHLAKMTDVQFVKVIGAKPETIRVPGKEGLSFSVEVNMPAGLCQTRVSVIGPSGRVDNYTDICSNPTLTLRRGN